ncbi:putative DNA polymerase-like protein, partial [Triplophysa rosa]
ADEKCSEAGHGSHPDQTLSDLLQGAIGMHAESHHHNTDRLRLLLNTHPVHEQTFNSTPPQQISNLEYLEAAIRESTDFNPCIRLCEILNTRDTNTVQDGSVLSDTSVPTADSAPPRGNVDNERPSTSDTQRTSSVDLDALIRDRGIINSYRVLPRPRFNSVELRRPKNLRDIGATDLATYHVRLHETMNEIATFARQIGGDGSVVSLTLSGPRLKSDVTAILSPGNDYDVNVFTDQIKKFLQSDDRLMCDDAVEIGATVASNRQGGGRHRRILTDLALDQVIKRKKTSLFCPINIANNLCFSICLAHFLDPELPESDLESRAEVIQNEAGFTIQDKIGLHDIATFERRFGICSEEGGTRAVGQEGGASGVRDNEYQLYAHRSCMPHGELGSIRGRATGLPTREDRARKC